jgi:hypothetical protein
MAEIKIDSTRFHIARPLNTSVFPEDIGND